MTKNFGKGNDAQTHDQPDRYQARYNKSHSDTWFIYDCEQERVVDVVHGEGAEHVIGQRTAMRNHPSAEQ